jgi:alpha-N-arabinofuranosidase
MNTVELLKYLDMPVLRWPGGCFADDYHWEDGVGPREERPKRRNLWWAQGREERFIETNEFGTDEFLELCQMVDTDPYLAVNVGSATPEEALDWIEYCNSDADTDLTQRSAENGQDEPYDVTYWGIGNESWSCGVQYDPDEYAEDYTRFASFLSTFEAGMLGDDHNLEFIAVGNSDREWNRVFLDNVNRYLPDHIGLHSYIGKAHCGDGADFDDAEYYRLLAQAREMDEFVQRARDTTNSMFPEVTIAVDDISVPLPTPCDGGGLGGGEAVTETHWTGL